MKPFVDLTRRHILAAGLGFALVGCTSTRRRPPLSREPIWTGGDADSGTSGQSNPPSTGNRPIGSDDSRTIIDRSEWTRQAPIMSLANPMGSISRITVHHDGMPPVSLRSQREVADRIESIRREHVRQGWADIGYHYVIDPQGRIWRGRPRTLQGAHVKYNNENNLGVLVLGNFEEQQPTQAALAPLDDFVVGNMRLFRVPPSRVYTHQELRPTVCPGRNLQAHMQRTRSYGGTIARA